MNLNALTQPVLVAFISLATPVRQALLEPVRLPGQTAQQSPDDYAVSWPRHQLGLLCQHVEALVYLGPNWDGYGAVPPSAEAIGNVLDLLARLPGAWVLRLCCDDITPTPYGTVAVEWANATDYVSLEVGDTQWAFTAEIDSILHDAPAVAYPHAELRQRVTEALAALYPDAEPYEATGYSA